MAAEGCSEWNNTLVGYFLGSKLHYAAVNTIAHKIWGKAGLSEVLSSDNGYFFFKFAHREGMDSVLERAPWHMANRPLVLKGWHSNLTLSKEDLNKIPLWVKLYHVPMAFWTKTGLSYVASAVGRPLHTDKLTAIKKRISYARVCVEVEASEELVKDFDLQCENGEWVPAGKKGKAKAGSSNETVNVIGDKHDKAESSTVNDETEAGQGGNDTDPGEFGVANSGMKPVNDVQQTIGSEVGQVRVP